MSEYEGREQSQVKHQVLRKYLERFAYIIGSKLANAITYVDGFSGPWNSQSSSFSDSSFAIALGELRKARENLAAKYGKSFAVNCFFIEKDERAYKELESFARGVEDANIQTRNASLGDAIPDIVKFISGARPASFPFIFLDPKGWTGLELDLITPLLQLKPGEVLVNFMTSFIRRFIKSPDAATQRSFDRLFGTFRPDVTEL
jgi:three-Cys-motif partner protein